MDIRSLNIFKTTKFWAGILLAQFVLFFILSRIEPAILFFERFFEWQKHWHQKLFSAVPFSVGDLFYVSLGIALFIIILSIFKKRLKRKALLLLLIILNIMYFQYQTFWGMLYFQKPLISLLPSKEITREETQHLINKYLILCKQNRAQVSEDTKGIFKIKNITKIKKEIIQNQRQLPQSFRYKKLTEIISLKPSLFGKMMNFTGILGYYNPFTAEAQYNSNLPPTSLLFTLCHESAHQLGFAREQEASFIGFLTAKNAESKELQYSAHLFALKSLLRSLPKEDSVFVKHTLNSYSAGMKRDYLEEKKFAADHEGWLSDFFGMTNNLFLKSNQQEGSVTYSYFTELLIRYERLETDEIP